MNTTIGLGLALALLAAGPGLAKTIEPARRNHAPRDYYGLAGGAAPELAPASRLGPPRGENIGRGEAGARLGAPEGPGNFSD